MIFVILFVFLFAIVAGVILLIARVTGRSQLKRFASALEATTAAEAELQSTDLLAGASEGIAGFKQLLDKLNLTRTIEMLIQQAGLDWSVGRLTMLCAGGAAAGAMAGLMTQMAVSPQLSALLLGGAGASAPFFYLRFKRKRRIAAFEEQFPEALEFVSRALRAGHAFSMSLDLLSKEFAEPIAGEFKRVYNEQNLGSPVEEALRNLMGRVPLVDVGFFVSSVLLQRETGGNLTEILDNLAFIIRERFRLKGHVSATSASAKMTGIVLTLMPIGLAFMLNIVNPGYLETMVEDDLGQKLIIGAIVAQIVGYLIIKKIVDIKV